MADKFIDELDAVTTWLNSDYEVFESDPLGTPETVWMTKGSAMDNYNRRLNYQISRTVSGNSLTVEIKDSDGNIPSPTKPIYFSIAGSVRSLIATLQVQVSFGAAGGTGTFKAGSTELANNPIDLFVYIGWRTSTGGDIFALISRIPYAKTYGDFSATASNEKYGAYSGAAPASTDAVRVIGRVNVQNSGSASYNWSIPSTSIIVHHPIYETEWLTWTPTVTGFATPPTYTAKYHITFDKLEWNAVVNTLQASNATTLTLSYPFAAGALGIAYQTVGGRGNDNGAECTPTFSIASGSAIMSAYKGPGQTAWTAAGTKYANGQGFYLIR